MACSLQEQLNKIKKILGVDESINQETYQIFESIYTNNTPHDNYLEDDPFINICGAFLIINKDMHINTKQAILYKIIKQIERIINKKSNENNKIIDLFILPSNATYDLTNNNAVKLYLQFDIPDQYRITINKDNDGFFINIGPDLKVYWPAVEDKQWIILETDFDVTENTLLKDDIYHILDTYTYAIDTIIEIAKTYDCEVQGGGKKKTRKSISSMVRKKYNIPSNMSVDKAYEYMSNTYSKQELAKYAKLKSTTSLNKNKIIDVLLS
jgi:hypothetical protein